MNWKDVDGYKGLYQVSDNGEVRSFYHNPPLLLKKSMTTTGYYKVELAKDGKKKSLRVHRLVASAFLPCVEGKSLVNHIDGNPLNNNVNNLEWCTQKENVNHALKIGLKKLKSINAEQYSEYKTEGKTIIQIASEIGVSRKRLIQEFDKQGIDHSNDKYHIKREELIKLFDKGCKNKEISELFNCPNTLIARRRYQYKKGEY